MRRGQLGPFLAEWMQLLSFPTDASVNRCLTNSAVLFCIGGAGFALLPSALADEFSDRPQWIVPQVTRDDVLRERLTAEALVLEARILERRGKQAAALRKYQRAWRLDGSRTDTILKQIVPLALELGRVEEATRYALLLTDSNLDDPFLAERLALLMSDQLEYDRSLQLYQQVLKLRNEDPQSRNPIAMQFEMGRLFFLTGKHEQAAQAFRGVLRALESNTEEVASARYRQAFLKDKKSIYTLFAEAFLEAGSYEEAELTFRKANEAAPDQEWLTLQLARVDYRAGRYTAAQNKLQDYVTQKLRFGGTTPYELLRDMMHRAAQANRETASKVAAVTVPHADNQNAAGPPENSQDADHPNADGIFERFRDWLADDPDNFPLLSYVADLSRRQGILQEAAALYEQSLQQSPTAEAYQQLLLIYRDLGDFDKLLDLLTSIASTSGDFGIVEAQTSTIAADKELVSQLLDLGRQRLKQPSAKSRAVAVACGLLALEARDYASAEEFFESDRNDDRRSGLYVTWGLQLLMDDEYNLAAKVFRMGLQANPEADARAILQYYLSGALQLSGKTQQALAVAEQVAHQANRVPEYGLRHAWIKYHAGRLDEAKVAYQDWLAQFAEDYRVPGLRDVVRDARFVFSTICAKRGEFDTAIECLEQVLDEFPQDVAAMNDLGYLLVDNNQSLQRATKMIRFAVRQEPNNTMFRDSLGWALFRLQKFDEAVCELEKAASDKPPDPIILDHLADAQMATGDCQSALQNWKRALTLIEPHGQEQLRQEIEAKLKKAESKSWQAIRSGQTSSTAKDDKMHSEASSGAN